MNDQHLDHLFIIFLEILDLYIDLRHLFECPHTYLNGLCINATHNKSA